MVEFLDPKERFTGRAEDYAKYRPHYPDSILQPLRDDCGLSSESVVADIACGTGLLSEVFLHHGIQVIGIEPNAEMRAAAAEYLAGVPGFQLVNASGEETSLPPASVDFITVGQALHWLDAARAKAEFLRIRRPRGFIVLAWNRRRTEGDSFAAAYHQLARRWGGGEAAVAARRTSDEQIRDFFWPASFSRRTFPNEQRFDWEGLRGRLLSSSYAPPKGHPAHDPMMKELALIFQAHERQGIVRIEYATEIFYGGLAG